MSVLQNTRGVCSKMILDIRRITFWTNIIVQSIFFIFYGYSIFDNIKNIPLLVIYSILLAVAITGFTTYLITHIKKIKNPKRFARTLRILKYVANGTMIALSIYELIKFGMGDFSKILLVVSIMSLLLQIIIELIRVFVERYVELYMASLKMDLAIFTKLEEMKDGGFWGWVNPSLEALANKFEHKTPEAPQLNEVEKYVLEIGEKHEMELQAKKEQKDELKERRKAEAKQKIIKNLTRIKNCIFKKKKSIDIPKTEQ